MHQLNSKETKTDEPKGYDFDELRFRRAYALAKYEMAKARLVEEMSTVKDKMPLASGGGIARKILGSLNYLDYALIAFRVFTKIRGFRKKKR